MAPVIQKVFKLLKGAHSLVSVVGTDVGKKSLTHLGTGVANETIPSNSANCMLTCAKQMARGFGPGQAELCTDPRAAGRR